MTDLYKCVKRNSLPLNYKTINYTSIKFLLKRIWRM